jgi:hypothetical protein
MNGYECHVEAKDVKIYVEFTGWEKCMNSVYISRVYEISSANTEQFRLIKEGRTPFHNGQYEEDANVPTIPILT